jgi:hypothetical protein
MKVQGPGTNEFKHFYWSKALNWSQGFLDEGPRPKTMLNGERAHDLENQESG